PGHHAAREPVLLLLEHEAGPRLVDVGALAEQARVLSDLRLAPAGHQHDLDVRAQAGLNRAHAFDRDVAPAVVEQRGPTSEKRAVEIQVQAANAGAARHTRSATDASGGRSTGPSGASCKRPSAARRAARVASTVRAIGSSSASDLCGLRCSSRSTWASPASPTARHASRSIAISTP